MRSHMKFAVPIVVAALALSACGTRGEESNAGSTGGAKKTVKIGVIAPLSGDLSALGKGIQHSVELAVMQANQENAIPGWEIKVEPVDDEGKADVGKNGATKLAADDQVGGLVFVNLDVGYLVVIIKMEMKLGQVLIEVESAARKIRGLNRRI